MPLIASSPAVIHNGVFISGQVERTYINVWTSASAADNKPLSFRIIPPSNELMLSDRDSIAFFGEADESPTDKALERASKFNSGKFVGSDYHW